MKPTMLIVALGAAVAITGMTAGATWAQDVPTAINERQELMKQQGRDLGAIRALVEGRGDQAAARRAAAELATTTISRIPSLFPQGTSSAEYPGKTRAKPAIWAEWNQFNAAQQAALAKAQALNAAVSAGNTAGIQTALTDLVNNGCNGCHTPFREPRQQ